jgi:hypothetical protein
MNLDAYLFDVISEYQLMKLYKRKNVIGVGTGIKTKNGIETNQKAIIIFVTNKEPKHRLRSTDIIPSSINGIMTDVYGSAGHFKIQKYKKSNKSQNKMPLVIKAQAINGMLERPIYAGTSISHLYVTAGTLGGYFKDRDGDIVLLSNQHVIVGEETNGKYGPSPRKGNLIIQPGTFDGGTVHNAFASLKSWVPLKPNNNLEDSAIAKIANLSLIKNEIKGIGKLTGFAKAVVGLNVQKVGRSTGHTTGKVISVNTSVCVDYGKINRCFDNCIITTSMSSGGDSGSILFDKRLNAVGLLFAGSDAVTIYNPISGPMKTYGLQILDL